MRINTRKNMNYIPKEAGEIAADRIIKTVLAEFRIDPDVFYGKCRERYIVDVRKAIVKYITDMPHRLGCAAIGRLINKDHATAIYLNRTAADLIKTKDYCFMNIYDRIRSIADDVDGTKIVLEFELLRLEAEMKSLKTKLNNHTHDKSTIS